MDRFMCSEAIVLLQILSLSLSAFPDEDAVHASVRPLCLEPKSHCSICRGSEMFVWSKQALMIQRS
jgi:hypothetical protein